MRKQQSTVIFSILIFFIGFTNLAGEELKINKDGYFEKQGLNVIVLNDIYPEGHQGGIEIIQHGKRIATFFGGPEGGDTAALHGVSHGSLSFPAIVTGT